MTKISIIGGGNAGVWTALHYAYYTRNDKVKTQIELFHDPEIDTFPVGQATTLDVVNLLWYACGTDWYNNEIKATPKLGILYENFTKENIYHTFPFNDIAMQVDPKYFQRYLLNSGWFDVKEENVTDLDMVDADVIFDCRGNTKKDDEYEKVYCPVNSVLLAVGPQNELQLWSKHVATPDGWTFIIPNTTETLSYGYLYNSNITSEEEAKTNFRKMFPEAAGSYSQHFEHKDEIVNLPFESYIAKEPVRIDDAGRKIILTVNRLAFLEPMESTAISYYISMAKFCFKWVIGLKNETALSPTAILEMDNILMDDVENKIKSLFSEMHTFILWHYIKGSVYDTPFWKYAEEETLTEFESTQHPNFQNVVEFAKSMSYTDCRAMNPYDFDTGESDFGIWPPNSIKQWYDKYIT